MSNSRNSRTGQPPSNRTNEYFVPKDGIDREVITADICRYLGNDALVRPGTYENPQTRTVQAGYFITAYRNLTTEMIADLKADSARWEAERRQTSSRGGQPSGVEYRSSTTHQSRQYYGPTDAASSGYATPQPQVQSQAPAFPRDGGYNQPPIGSYAPQVYPPEPPYYGGADSRPIGGGIQSQTPLPPQPRNVYTQPSYAQSSSSYADSRSTPFYTQSAPGNVTPQQQQYSTQQQPSDPFYGRAVTAGSYDPPADPYEGGGYSQAPMQSGSPAIAQPRNQREPERDQRRHRHR